MPPTHHFPSSGNCFGGGAIIGALGGLIGLGGAEFRLPILIGFFNFPALEVVILNKAMSLVVVATALPFRAGTIPLRRYSRSLADRNQPPCGEPDRRLVRRRLGLLFGADIKLAGSLSLAVSLPTMVVGFTRYSRAQSFSVIGRNKSFLLLMAAGSIVGTYIGGKLLGIVPNAVLLLALAIILLISAVKVWRH
ncbi:UNVERIFIED_ORG: putative membrane protein YfcA [Rhizobium esperanzae]